jgi:neutral ceramidase
VIAWGAVVCSLGWPALGCLGKGRPETVAMPPVAQIRSVEASVMAAAREVDITPPPGLPSYGHASNGVGEVNGYWLRLKARVVVVQHGGDRVALVQLDLGAASDLLHRRLAASLADLGIGPHNLLTAASHTHGGPGAFFGTRFLNGFVAGRPAYEPEFVAWLVERIGGGVREAFAALRPARLATTQVAVEASATFNRSRGAWRRNFDNHGLRLPAEEVDRTLTLLRVDVDDRPIAVHGNTMPADYPVFHGDVQGVAARLLARWVEQRYGARDFVAAMANGAEGDVAAGDRATRERGKELTMRVGGQVASAAFRAFTRLDGADHSEALVPLATAYREVSLRAAGTRRGRLCAMPLLGAPQLGGSEEGRGPLYGFLDMYEGAQKPPAGCDATKVKVGGVLQDLVVEELDYPDVVPFQLVAFGGKLVLATVPGEPTTEVGRAAAAAVAGASGCETVAVVGLADGYATYFTMPDEFLEQHYEGGATIYGPYQGLLAVEQLGDLAGRLGTPEAARFASARVFEPGEAGGAFPTGSCDPAAWEAGELSIEGGLVTFRWEGVGEGERCALPPVSVRCDGKVLEDDDGFDFEVRRDGGRTWEALWQMRKPARGCRVQVGRGKLAPLASEAFDAGG